MLAISLRLFSCFELGLARTMKLADVPGSYVGDVKHVVHLEEIYSVQKR